MNHPSRTYTQMRRQRTGQLIQYKKQRQNIPNFVFNIQLQAIGKNILEVNCVIGAHRVCLDFFPRIYRWANFRGGKTKAESQGSHPFQFFFRLLFVIQDPQKSRLRNRANLCQLRGFLSCQAQSVLFFPAWASYV